MRHLLCRLLCHLPLLAIIIAAVVGTSEGKVEKGVTSEEEREKAITEERNTERENETVASGGVAAVGSGRKTGSGARPAGDRVI